MYKGQKSTMEFRWDLYEDGFNGRNLVRNKKIKTGNKHTIVYCHEDYAAELLPKYGVGSEADAAVEVKDLILGTSLRVTALKATGNLTIVADTAGGGSCIIDMNKEREYCKQFGYSNPADFVSYLSNPDAALDFVENFKPIVKVVSKDRVSLWDGFLISVEKELIRAYNDQDTAYQATIVGTNRGGFICNVRGVKCFLPGSMASAGVVTDFNSMIGKVLPVMVVNHTSDNDIPFIVSYERYLSKILPEKAKKELEINSSVFCRVTGTSKNGIFVSFDDKEGEPVFSGLIYRDNMSSFLESEFDRGNIRRNDQMRAYIYRVEVDNEGKVRVNLGDMQMYSQEYNDKQARLRRQKLAADNQQAPAQSKEEPANE